MSFIYNKFFNIAFVNSERSLSNSRVDIIPCLHALLLKLFYIFRAIS